eukprot:COSAG06_NODE_2730_length_6376_cov_5.812171_4_plen_169_part_00
MGRFETDQKVLTAAPAGAAAPTGPATAPASPGASRTELIRVFYAVLYPKIPKMAGSTTMEEQNPLGSCSRPPLEPSAVQHTSTRHRAPVTWLSLTAVALALRPPGMHAVWLLLAALFTALFTAAPAPPPISPKCQAELNAYCNDDKLNGPHCIDPTTKWCELLAGDVP